MLYLYGLYYYKKQTFMAEQILVTADKRVEELMKQFNQTFEYLRLRLYTSEARLYIGVDNLTPYRVDIDSTVEQVRVNKGKEGEISIDASKTIGALEDEFYETFGLVVQVCYTTADGHNTYTYQKEQDMMTLGEFNAACAADGCIAGEWK